MKVKCINTKNLTAWECNACLVLMERWLRENAGQRWVDWDWLECGHVEFMPHKSNEAFIFKIKFGVA
jgi:hypothetical protein